MLKWLEMWAFRRAAKRAAQERAKLIAEWEKQVVLPLPTWKVIEAANSGYLNNIKLSADGVEVVRFIAAHYVVIDALGRAGDRARRRNTIMLVHSSPGVAAFIFVAFVVGAPLLVTGLFFVIVAVLKRQGLKQ